ncbi:proline/betaine ABC transporter permease ProW, partial [Klebsiella pneumoniae]
IGTLIGMLQTVPTFVFLIPTLTLFGLGVVPGLISTVIFAVAAPIRLTCLGIQGRPPELLGARDVIRHSP